MSYYMYLKNNFKIPFSCEDIRDRPFKFTLHLNFVNTSKFLTLYKLEKLTLTSGQTCYTSYFIFMKHESENRIEKFLLDLKLLMDVCTYGRTNGRTIVRTD